VIPQGVDILTACLGERALRIEHVQLRADTFIVASLRNVERTLGGADVIDLRVKNRARCAQVRPGSPHLQLDLTRSFGFRFAGLAATRNGFGHLTLSQEAVEQRPGEPDADQATM